MCIGPTAAAQQGQAPSRWGKAKPSDRASRLDAAVEELAGRGRIVVEKGARGSKLIRVVGVVH